MGTAIAGVSRGACRCDDARQRNMPNDGVVADVSICPASGNGCRQQHALPIDPHLPLAAQWHTNRWDRGTERR